MLLTSLIESPAPSESSPSPIAASPRSDGGEQRAASLLDLEVHEVETLEYDPMAPKAFTPHEVSHEEIPRKVVIDR